jgi:hypothetical protein
MPCACQKNAKAFGVGPNDLIPFASAETTEPYSGTYRTSSTYVVGWGTESEALFPVSARSEAIAHSKSVSPRLSFHKVRASRLPHDIGLAVYGS